MAVLKIISFNGEPAEICRYWVPRECEAGTEGFVIMVEPLSPDNPYAVDETRYGMVRILTEDGVRVVSTIGLGVLVEADGVA